MNDSIFFQEKITVDVIIAERSKTEAGVLGVVNKKRWLITGGGKNFRTYPIPANSETEKINFKPKGFNKFLGGEVHFMVASEDGTESGRWEGPSFVLEGLQDEDTLILKSDDSVWIRKGQQNASQKLVPKEEHRVYLQQNMDQRTEQLQHLRDVLTVVGLVVAIIAIPAGI